MRDALRKIVVEGHTVKTIADQFVQIEALKVPVASFVSNVVEKITSKID